MPLFGNKHHDNHTTEPMASNTTAGYGDNTMGDHHRTNQPINLDSGMGPGINSSGPGPLHHTTATGHHAGPAGGPMPGQGYDEGMVGRGGAGNHIGSGNTGLGHHNNDPYGAAGVGNTAIPLPNTVNHPGTHKASGGGSALTGKIEHAVGTMIGSQSLKAKGLEKEREATAFKVQGQELSEAERLEREAMMRRERAVAHGAHPDNRHLGGASGGAGNVGGGGY